MPFELAFGAGLGMAAISLLVWSFAHLIWALLGQREARSWRLRRALWSFLLAGASVAMVAAIYHSVLLVHPTMRVMRPEYSVPYRWATALLAILMLPAILASVVMLMRMLRLGGGKRALLALAWLATFAAMGVANYALTHSVQVPAYQRYTMIESREWKTRVGDAAPEFDVTMLDGSPVSSSELRGKVVLVNFFATWCGPCMYELPHLEELWNEMKNNDDFRMLVVDRGETREVVAAFQEKKGFTFPMALDADSTMYKQFADQGIPRTYLISRDGKILFQTLGFADLPLYERELATLRNLIAEELGKTP